MGIRLIYVIVLFELFVMIIPIKSYGSFIEAPKFVKKPPPKLYATDSKPAMIICRVKHATELAINCIEIKEVKSQTSTAIMSNNSHEESVLQWTEKARQPLRRKRKALSMNSLVKSGTFLTQPRDTIWKYVTPHYHEVRLNLTENTLSTWFVKNFWCRCEAYNTVKGQFPGKFANTSKTLVLVAYLNPDFKQEPNDSELYIGRYVKLTCKPPDGLPKPDVTWLKDGREIDKDIDGDIQISQDGSLVIESSRKSDSGLYQCVATNIANRILSKSARLTVLDKKDQNNENGGDWLTWNPWTSCPTGCKYGIYCANSCLQFKRVRKRLCSSSSSGKKTKCSGNNMETESCASICRVDGGWGNWAPWSLCQPDCTKKRMRDCDSPSPRAGGKPCLPRNGYFAKENCTENLCQKFTEKKGSPRHVFSIRDIIVYIILSVALFLLIIITTLVICFQKRQLLLNNNGNSLNGKVFSGKNAFVLMKKMDEKESSRKDTNTETYTTFNVDPSLRDPLNIVTMNPLISINSNYNNTHANPLIVSTNNFAPQQPQQCMPTYIQSTPSVTQSYSYSSNQIAGISSSPHPPFSLVNSHSTTPNPTINNNHVSCHYKEVGLGNLVPHNATIQPNILPNFNSITTPNIFMPNNANTIITNNGTLGTNNNDDDSLTRIIGSAGIDTSTQMTFENTNFNNNPTTKPCDHIVVNNSGGKVILGSTGVAVTIMPDTFHHNDDYQIELYTKNTHDRLVEYRDYTQLSSMVICNLSESAKLKRPVILSFPHCLVPSKSGSFLQNWELIVVQTDTNGQWEVFIHINQDSNSQLTPDIVSRNYCHLNDANCTLMVYDFQPFCLLGRPIQTSSSYPPTDPRSIPDHSLIPQFEVEKRLCVVVFSEPPPVLSSPTVVHLTCYIFIDTKDIRDQLIMKITSAGCRIYDVPKSFYIKQIPENIIMTIESSVPNWKIAAISKFQEISHDELWKIKTETYYPRNIQLEQGSNNSQSFSGTLCVYQNNYYKDKIEIPLQIGPEFHSSNSQLNISNITNVYPTCKFISPSKIFRLPRATIRDLATKLDPPSISVSQWKMIAKQLGISTNLEYFLSQPSPTTYLLQLWEANNRDETALVDLKSTLKVMGLIEISDIIC